MDSQLMLLLSRYLNAQPLGVADAVAITNHQGSKFSQRRCGPALLAPEQVKNYLTKQATRAHSLFKPEKRRLRLWGQYGARDACVLMRNMYIEFSDYHRM
ncbi:hypothetical protein N7455_007978 [Penicillium solitum]|uniref:uncharacterized protein n=1 Tax=Penicillium solitum TaxID=60172 RepID=UPI0032C401FD|nr:hypothetical protein N7455_007978 [Penicillium solitum]